jgi:hypothetical protein
MRRSFVSSWKMWKYHPATRRMSQVSWLPCVTYVDDCRWNSEYPTGQCSGGYNEHLLFLQCNWSKSTKWKALESLEKRHYETLWFLEMYFLPAFFDISVHFTTHIIKEIILLGPVFLPRCMRTRDSMAYWSHSLEIELTLRATWYKDTVQRKPWSGP